jgi:hypothetical protein
MKSFEIETASNDIEVREHGVKGFSLFISDYDGWTYFSLDEMKRLVEGMQEMIVSIDTTETKGECNAD